MMVLLVVMIILLVILILMIKRLSDDLWDFQTYSDMQYAELLDVVDDKSTLENKIYETVIKSLEAEDKVYKLIKDWSEKNG